MVVPMLIMDLMLGIHDYAGINESLSDAVRVGLKFFTAKDMIEKGLSIAVG